MGVAAAARLGSRPLPGPAAARQRGHARRHHRGLAARAAPPHAPLGRDPGRPRLPDRRPGRPRARAGRAGTGHLLDPVEAQLSGTLGTGEAALVLGLESFAVPVEGEAGLALEVCRDAGLRVLEQGARGQAGEAWRSTFVRAPYLRESLVLLGVLVETFETAVTWDRFEALVADVTAAVTDALRRVCGGGAVGCRLTHVYPDGAAPYFTVLAPARRGSEVAQWDEVKAAAGEALAAGGGTITHHHAVGRDHRPWYDGQRPEPFALALGGAKHALDPAGILNPGVLLG
ncbi:MAG: FAD-linked oxidase C-terminal domain-containing protein [Mycobacteriales bacterium]